METWCMSIHGAYHGLFRPQHCRTEYEGAMTKFHSDNREGADCAESMNQGCQVDGHRVGIASRSGSGGGKISRLNLVQHQRSDTETARHCRAQPVSPHLHRNIDQG
jgi:hypothetical protein